MTCKPTLDPEAPNLDEDTRRRRRILAKMENISTKELFDLAIRAGIYALMENLQNIIVMMNQKIFQPVDLQIN